MLRLGFPAGSAGGGKSRLRGVDSQLQGLLEDPFLKVPHDLQHWPFTVGDEPPVLGRIHGVHHLRQHPLQLLRHLRRQLLPIHLYEPIHGFSCWGASAPIITPYSSTLCPMPESFGRPAKSFHATLVGGPVDKPDGWEFRPISIRNPAPAPGQGFVGRVVEKPADAGKRTVALELAFDDQRLFTLRRSFTDGAGPAESTYLNLWDGKTGLYYNHSPTRNSWNLATSPQFMGPFFWEPVWGRNGQHYWWREEGKWDDFVGSPEDYRIVGREVYRGTDCYVLEGAGRRLCIGVADHRLYGLSHPFVVVWWSDYREVAPGRWMPMVHGQEGWETEGAAGPQVRSRVEMRFTELAVDQPLPEELFQFTVKNEAVTLPPPATGPAATQPANDAAP